MPELPDLLWDADTVDYIRREAQLGAEQAKALRDVVMKRLVAAPDAMPSTLLSHFTTAVRMHAVYLTLLRETVFGKDGALYADEEEDDA